MISDIRIVCIVGLVHVSLLLVQEIPVGTLPSFFHSYHPGFFGFDRTTMEYVDSRDSLEWKTLGTGEVILISMRKCGLQKQLSEEEQMEALTVMMGWMLMAMFAHAVSVMIMLGH